MIYANYFSNEILECDDFVRMDCIFHLDKQQQLEINKRNDGWKCLTCGKSGGPYEFFSMLLDSDDEIAARVVGAYKRDGTMLLPTVEMVDGMHRELLERPSEIEKLAIIGITRESIEKFKLGYDNRWIIFPIYSSRGHIVNLRKILPEHRRGDESRAGQSVWMRQLGAMKARLYPLEAFEGNTVYLVDTERDCISARSQGINAVCFTGAATPLRGQTQMFYGKQVYILYTDAKKVRTLRRLIAPVAEDLRFLKIPADSFLEYYLKCTKAKEPINILDLQEQAGLNAEVMQVSLAEAEEASMLDERVKLGDITIIGTDPTTYAVPTKFEFFCKVYDCHKACPLSDTSYSGMGYRAGADARSIIHFMDSNDRQQNRFAQEKFNCTKARAKSIENMNAQKILFQESSQLVDSMEEITFGYRQGVYLHKRGGLKTGQRYSLTASRVTDPRTQAVLYYVTEAEPVSEIKPIGKVGLKNLKEETAKFNTANELLSHFYKEWLPVLGIEGRLDLFGAMLLTYASVTWVPWKGDKVKGWLDIICIGDSRTGKSQMARRFVKTLQMGSYMDGEVASRAGILGGSQHFGSKVVTWGAIPLNDRGLLVIDEASGLDEGIIKELSSARRHGEAQITMTAQGRAPARTRLIWLSNPRTGMYVKEHKPWQGFSAFKNFIPAHEDQARFDLVITALSGEVEEEGYDIAVKNGFVNKWRGIFAIAWAIGKEQIKIDDATANHVVRLARKIAAELSGGPLIMKEDAYEKILRLGCAFAVLCGSVVDGQLELEKRHVEFAHEFLHYCMTRPALMYVEFIGSLKQAMKNDAESKEFIKGMVGSCPQKRRALTLNEFTGGQFANVHGGTAEEAVELLNGLLKRGLVILQPDGSYRQAKSLENIARQIGA